MAVNITSVDEAYGLLLSKISLENQLFYGVNDENYAKFISSAWMNDKTNSKWRYEFIDKYYPLGKGLKILDMASGCGTFVFYGLLNNFEVFGVDPEEWKYELIKKKIDCYSYPKEWEKRFIKGYGEDLPFEDEFFDIVSSYQTLEHVSDVELCIYEMFRVIKPGGYIFLQFPDYNSTFEGHYRLPWFPMFPKHIAQKYLKIMNRPIEGLKTINYISLEEIIKKCRKTAFRHEIVYKNIKGGKFFRQERSAQIVIKKG
jgi:ubiquinone/menaquinone biosynthesis C-methylase UbiE